MMGNLTHAKKLKFEKKGQKWLELKNCGWFWVELRIFNLTHQKKSEAKVDLGSHFINM